ncbi:MAG: methyltransferase domain-containing protein [Pseudohongiella sp.]|nr:methyltransferase domain-containing protein [Pseudohongiella sp.]MDP2128723.1 methyltransferase domain-containing protein [Pseudohongiella sp.]
MDYYNKNAPQLFRQYESLPVEKVHEPWLKLLPEQPGLACDIGAGSGRDARWLATQGWDVVAVEPATELRLQGERQNVLPASSASIKSSGSVTWLDDTLPELKKLRALDQRFNLILISAVWMHMPAAQHQRAMRIVSELLAPGGLLVITLRNGPDDHDRFFPVSADDVIALAQDRALISKYRSRGDDLQRADIEWDSLVFQLPDDGSGSLPLLRHIIVNDNKAASYKLGLLRVLIRIAEGAPGMVTRRTDDWVEIPFGLVGLYWIKTYLPLVLRHNLVQAPKADHRNQTGYGWAKPQHFYSLQDQSAYDLRIGASFNAETSKRLRGAIHDACLNIKNMPAKYITYPGQSRQVFECETRTFRHRDSSWQITKESLQHFGSFRIPAQLWQTMSQYACWLEPAILNEWVKLMQSWRAEYSLSVYSNVFQWIEADRDTSKVRNRFQQLQNEGKPLHCVWTEKMLGNERYAIDHCFPWSRWLNNDLWNLMPTTEKANSAKADKLPSAALMHYSKKLIVDWWQQAYLDDNSLQQQFFVEAQSALPLLDDNAKTLEPVFHAMQHQRARLKANQQLAEWGYLRSR